MTTLQAVFFWVGVGCIVCFAVLLLIAFASEFVESARKHKWL